MGRFAKIKKKVLGSSEKGTDNLTDGDKAPSLVTSPPNPATSQSASAAAISSPESPQATPNETPISPNLESVSASPVPDPPAHIASTTRSLAQHEDPWTLAFDILQDREPELAADYKTHLGSLQDDPAASIDLSAPRSTESMVKQLLDNRDERQWRVSLLGKDMKMREQAEKLAKFLLWSDPVVKNALSAQPHAALAWSGVSILLPLLTSGTTKVEAMLKGFNSIGEVQVYWGICEKTYLESAHRQTYQDLVEPLAKLYSHILEYQARAICHLSKAQLSRAWERVAGWNEWEAKVRLIDDMSKKCSDCISPLQEVEIRERWSSQLQEMRQSRTILDEIRQILEDGQRQNRMEAEDQHQRDLLQSLAGDYEGFKDFNPRRVEGTCEWFFSDARFHEWRDSDASKLLWVAAGPGCGKSVLSRALVDERRLSTNVTTSTTCHFFFKDGDENRMHSTNALCAILHQIFTQDLDGNLIGIALPSHKTYGDQLKKNLSELWKILLKCASSPDAGEIICILDALDECEKSSRDQLIEKLKDFYCGEDKMLQSSRLRFVITSRPYDDLEAYFSEFPTTKYLQFDGDDKSADIGREINLVIDKRVTEVASSFSAEGQRKLSERLKNTENRTYLWLFLIFDTIKDNLSRYKKWSSMEKLLSDIPWRVSDAYEKILSRSQDEEKTRLLLQILLAAPRSLTLDEANMALTVAGQEQQLLTHEAACSDLWPQDAFKSIVRNLCGLFVSVHDSKLSFIHQTAREFLTNPGPGKWAGQFDIPSAHGTLSTVCLHYLLLPDLTSLSQKFFYIDRSFFHYAATYWPLHFKSQDDATADESRSSARTLCRVHSDITHYWAPVFFAAPYDSWSYRSDLALATHLGLKLVVEDIISQEKPKDDYNGALREAATQGDREMLQFLLDSGADNLNQALCYASAHAGRDTVQFLLDSGADDTNEALVWAAEKGQLEIVHLLLDHGADNLNEALKSTVKSDRQGHLETAQLLIDSGADDLNSAFHEAIVYHRIGMVGLLLDNGADEVELALQTLSGGFHFDMVELILDKSNKDRAELEKHFVPNNCIVS